MHAPPPGTDAQPTLTEAEAARARLDRIARTAQEPVRPTPEGARAADALRQRRHGAGRREGFRLGWGGWLVVELVVIAAIAGIYLAWPPTAACREQEATLGFFAGDTLGKCIRRGVAARIDDVDQRLKMAVRHSGH